MKIPFIASLWNSFLKEEIRNSQKTSKNQINWEKKKVHPEAETIVFAIIIIIIIIIVNKKANYKYLAIKKVNYQYLLVNKKQSKAYSEPQQNDLPNSYLCHGEKIRGYQVLTHELEVPIPPFLRHDRNISKQSLQLCHQMKTEEERKINKLN